MSVIRLSANASDEAASDIRFLRFASDCEYSGSSISYSVSHGVNSTPTSFLQVPLLYSLPSLNRCILIRAQRRKEDDYWTTLKLVPQNALRFRHLFVKLLLILGLRGQWTGSNTPLACERL